MDTKEEIHEVPDRRTMAKSRLESFSDGVIAIIITIMVFDLKLQEFPAHFSRQEVWEALWALLPKLGAYTISFVVLGIMWLNHHILFNQIRYSTSSLVWFNHHLLFWMSLIPLPTAFLERHPVLPEANMFYGIILGMNALAFTLLRWYAAVRAQLMPDERIFHISNIVSTVLYFLAAGLAFVNIYLSYLIFIGIPIWYFLPDRIGGRQEKMSRLGRRLSHK
jgi:uncharacterized membrane protein